MIMEAVMSKDKKPDKRPRVRERTRRKCNKASEAPLGINGKASGYKNPPAKNMWKKGKPSPNPSGRPKKARNYKSILRELLDSEVTIRDANGFRKITARRAYLMKIIDQALKGEIRPAEILLRIEDAMDAAALQAEIEEQRREAQKAADQGSSDIPDSFLDDYYKKRLRADQNKGKKNAKKIQ